MPTGQIAHLCNLGHIHEDVVGSAMHQGFRPCLWPPAFLAQAQCEHNTGHAHTSVSTADKLMLKSSSTLTAEHRLTCTHFKVEQVEFVGLL